MDTCVVCGRTASDPTLFTGYDPVVCIECHLELCEEDKPRISIDSFVEVEIPYGMPLDKWTLTGEFGGMKMWSPRDSK